MGQDYITIGIAVLVLGTILYAAVLLALLLTRRGADKTAEKQPEQQQPEGVRSSARYR